MDTKNDKKKQHSKNKVKSVHSLKKMGKSKKMGNGNQAKAKAKKYATVDFMQSCAYHLPEGLKIPYNRSGKAVLDRFSPNMDDAYPYKYTFHGQDNPSNASKTSVVLVPKRTKASPRRQQKVVTPSQRAAEDLFNELFFWSSSSNL